MYAIRSYYVIVAWAKKGMKQSPEEISKQLKIVLNDSKMFAMSKYLENL